LREPLRPASTRGVTSSFGEPLVHPRWNGWARGTPLDRIADGAASTLKRPRSALSAFRGVRAGWAQPLSAPTADRVRTKCILINDAPSRRVPLLRVRRRIRPIPKTRASRANARRSPRKVASEAEQSPIATSATAINGLKISAATLHGPVRSLTSAPPRVTSAPHARRAFNAHPCAMRTSKRAPRPLASFRPLPSTATRSFSLLPSLRSA
jgi:hypothetical protein